MQDTINYLTRICDNKRLKFIVKKSFIVLTITKNNISIDYKILKTDTPLDVERMLIELAF